MRADVCLILEGTYPYVAGGVSTWVAQILAAMPQVRFSIVYIGPRSDLPREFKYRIPHNVVDIQELFVHDYPIFHPGRFTDRRLSKEHWETVARFQTRLAKAQSVDIAGVLPALERIEDDVEFMRVFAHSRQAWELILAQYEETAPPGASFMEFYWTHHFVTLPALKLLRAKLPKARVYHAACTGYAGLLGAKAQVTTGAPLLLTEHGIYTRERRIEIFNSEWIRDVTSEDASLDLGRARNFHKEWWIRFFMALSKTAYNHAARVYALFEANRKDQVAEGAPARQTEIIPNGIDVGRFEAVPPRERTSDDPLHIGFIGRIAGIKDVKTFLRALELLKQHGVRFHTWIMGPLDEEEEYAQECIELKDSLDLEAEVEFTGRVDVKAYMARLDVVVLTSISEGLPFVILEANCAGRAVVASDVGACRELLEGRTPEDRALGPGGMVTPVATPAATAAALERMARDPALTRSMGEAGRERVTRYYDINDVMARYQHAYEYHFFAGLDRGRMQRPEEPLKLGPRDGRVLQSISHADAGEVLTPAAQAASTRRRHPSTKAQAAKHKG